DPLVTGVQTCALPISPMQASGSQTVPTAPQPVPPKESTPRSRRTKVWIAVATAAVSLAAAAAWILGRGFATRPLHSVAVLPFVKIGRAACRERVDEVG